MNWTAQSYNETAKAINRERIIAVRNGKVDQRRVGAILSGYTSDDYQHPWFCTPTFTQEEGDEKPIWRIRIKPGSVNGCEVMANGKPISEGYTLRVGGWNVGAAPPAAIAEEVGDRFLKTCEVILISPRITANQQISSTLGQIDITTSFSATIFNNVPRYQVVTSRELEALAEPTDLEWYLGLAVEPPYDQQRIATIYAVAPDIAGDDPDQSWTLYVKHHCFWNLNHASRADIGSSFEELKVSFLTALAGGIGNPSFAEIQQDQFLSAQINAWFAKSASQGYFWTV